MVNSELEIVFLPPLLQLLILSENNKGSLLTQEEVLNIRDNAIGMTVSKEELRSLKLLEVIKILNLKGVGMNGVFIKKTPSAETVN